MRLRRRWADARLRRVLVTHGHSDHASGVPALKASWPSLEACKWVEWPRHGRPGATNWPASRTVQQIHCRRRHAHGAIHTPGHAIDHVCFWNPATRDLYAGDMVVRGTTVMIPAGRGGGLRAYMTSLERLAALSPARILPGHGPIIDDPLALIAEYLEHRRMRDAQVAACLRDGIIDPDAIVHRLYPGLPPALLFAARATIESHIQKLREDGL